MNYNSPGLYVEGGEAFMIFRYITNEDHAGLLQFLKSTKKTLNIMEMKD